MRNLFFLLVLCCGMVLAAERSTYEVIDWSKEAKATGGEVKGELKRPDKPSSVMRYHIYAPATLPDKPVLGLVIAFHGLHSDENGVTGHAHQSLVEIGAADRYVVIGGKSVGDGWKAGDEEAVLQFIDWAETVYPIDRRRVFTWGHSNGGWMTSWFSSRHPDRIAGLVRWAGYGSDMPGGKGGSDLEYYLVHGDADPTVKVDGSRNLREQLRRSFHFVYRELHGADHGSLMGVTAVRDDAARWLDATRHKQVPPPPEDLRWLKQVLSDREALGRPETWDGLVRIGGTIAWQVAEKAAKSKSVDERLALAKACCACRFADEASVPVLERLAADDDAGVRAAATTALAMLANWHDQPAQLALAHLALAKKRSPEDRLAASRGLADALTLPLLGNTADDPTLADAAVALLDSDLAEVRSAIFAPLKVAMPDGLGYDPQADAKARRTPIAAWRSWFDERSGKPVKR